MNKTSKHLKRAAALSLLFCSLSLFVFGARVSSAVEPVLNELDKLPSEINCSQTEIYEQYGEEIREQIKQYCGDYELNDFASIAVKIAQIILGLTGSLALLMFIYGGVMFLVSAGSSEKIATARSVIVGAVIGIFIVFASYMIIGFVFKATGADISGTAWSKIDWFNK